MSSFSGRGRRHPVADAFIFLLLAAFAVFCTLLILLSARAYSGVVQRARQSDDERILIGYPLNKVRAMPGSGQVWTQETGGVKALVLSQSYDEESYLTRIYCYDGYMRELFTLEEAEFAPEDGERLIEAEWFRPSIEDGMLTLEVCGSDGRVYQAHQKERGA